MEPYGQSVGRRYKEETDTLIQDPFTNDFCKIIQSKAFRRLSDKTQVFSLTGDPHIRTRLAHTNEVIATSIAIADQLGLNESLCMAIAAGHDMGHTPYGHLGEEKLAKLSGKKFQHNVFGVVIAQHIERGGLGLNLAFETLEGILKSSRGAGKLSVDENVPHEYTAAMFADKISYTFADLNDAIRNRYLKKVPPVAKKLGWDQRTRTTKVVEALVAESKEKDAVSFSKGEVYEQFEELRSFMYKNVYHEINTYLHKGIVEGIYHFFSNDSKFKEKFPSLDPVIATALLTDKEADEFSGILMKMKKPSLDDIKHFGIFDIFSDFDFMKKDPAGIDYINPDLDWREKAV